jgi:hypothetical protein
MGAISSANGVDDILKRAMVSRLNLRFCGQITSYFSCYTCEMYRALTRIGGFAGKPRCDVQAHVELS